MLFFNLLHLLFLKFLFIFWALLVGNFLLLVIILLHKGFDFINFFRRFAILVVIVSSLLVGMRSQTLRLGLLELEGISLIVRHRDCHEKQRNDGRLFHHIIE